MKIKYALFISWLLGVLSTEGKKDIWVKVKGSEITITVPSSILYTYYMSSLIFYKFIIFTSF